MFKNYSSYGVLTWAVAVVFADPVPRPDLGEDNVEERQEGDDRQSSDQTVTQLPPPSGARLESRLWKETRK